MSCDLIKVNHGDENLKNGEHDGRLAVEQLYGYMIRNAKTLGLISTIKGWVFLFRRDHGVLYMTRMYGCHRNLNAAEVYFNLPAGCTILMALYYFTSLTEQWQAVVEARSDTGESCLQPRYSRETIHLHHLTSGHKTSLGDPKDPIETTPWLHSKSRRTPNWRRKLRNFSVAGLRVSQLSSQSSWRWPTTQRLSDRFSKSAARHWSHPNSL